MSAVYQSTAPDQVAPWAMPGEYTARLTVNGQAYEQKFSVKMDPRVQSTTAQLQEQFDLSMTCYKARKSAVDALAGIAKLENQINGIKNTSIEKETNDFKTKLGAMKGSGGISKRPQ